MHRPEPQLGTQGGVFGKRVVAVILDLVILAIVSGTLTTPLTVINPRIGGPIASLVSALISFAYFTALEGTYGQTLGKRVMDIVVVREDGSDCEMGSAAIRNVLRYVDWLPVLYLLGTVVIYLTEDDQRLGDVAADTFVVKTAE